MSAAWYIGRVGGLAVALGVGTAILTGQGIAAADDGSDGAPSSSSADAGSVGAAGADAAADSTPATQPAGKSKDDVTSKDTAGADDPGPSGESAPPMKVSASGGANTEVRKRSTATTEDVTTDTKPDTKSDTTSDADVAVSTRTAQDDLPAPPAPAPSAPAHDSATALMAAVARRELSTSATGFAPTWSAPEGVITGDVAPAPPSYYEVVSGPTNGGKVTFDASGDGDFTFLPDASQLTSEGYDRFKVLVAEKSPLVQLLEQVPVIKDLVKPIVLRLHQIPIVGTVLSPVIGTSRTYWVEVPVAQFVSSTPIAFTTKITSFDGVQVSVNYFPKVGLGAGQKAPTILNGPSLATAGYTDPAQQTTVFGLVPGLAMLREDYNVVTWDPRGEFASGGRLHLDSENFEARDVSAIIDWVAQQSTTKNEGTSLDPYLGMVGGSYGGGIQLTSAGIDDRIDAISPGIAWNDLTHTLYPEHAFKTSWASLLLLSLVASGSRLDPEIYYGIATGALFGFLTQGQQDFLSGNSPDTVADEITIPTLFLQGTVDTLFPLRQAWATATAINPEGEQQPVPMKMIWYCGGHGQCLDPVDLNQQTVYTTTQIINWMDTYVANKGQQPPVDPARFSWVDQDGNWWATAKLPTEAGFNGAVYPVPGTTSGLLPIVPVFGGSGPDWAARFPVSLVNGAKVEHGALNLYVPNPTPDQTTYYVGAPKVTLEYSGLGTSRNVYAQLVDNTTGRVLGNIVSPIPVILDGTTRTVDVDMEAIAYTMSPPDPNDPNAIPDSLTLQIFDSATAFENFTSYGVVNVKSVGLTLPTATNVQGLVMASG